MAKDCPDGSTKTCYKCGDKGHIAPDCPEGRRGADKGDKPKTRKRGEDDDDEDEDMDDKALLSNDEIEDL